MTSTTLLSQLLGGGTVAHSIAEIFQTIDQGVTLYDQDHCLVFWNRQYETFQIAPTELYQGASLLEIYRLAADQGVFGPGDPDRIAQTKITAQRTGEPIPTELLTLPSGTLVQVSQFPLRDGGFFAIFSDVTDKFRYEQQERQSAKLNAIGQLTSGVAHDLKNLLGVILGNLDMAIQSGGQSNPYLHKAVAAVDHGSDFVQRLLAFARQQPPEPRLVDVGELLSQFLLLFPPVLGEKIAIELHKPPETLTCEIDPNQLESVVMNLVLNSKEAIGNEGRIDIGLQNRIVGPEHAATLGIEPGPYLHIEVKDDGCGMTAETVAKAHVLFFTTKPSGSGTGLGLSMAKELCEQSGGTLEITSTQGIGTTVKLYIPCAQHQLTGSRELDETRFNWKTRSLQ